MKRLNQTGSHLIAGLLLVAVVGVIGFAGYKVVQSQKTSTTGTTTASTTAPKAIKSKADLSQANKALDASATQLNSTLNDSAFNADLTSML
ncbi:MAG: hypothetical protein WC498_01150 [Candidatus Saccharimonadales bacterium]